MPTNAFDTETMPGARAARANERRMAIPLSAYAIIVLLLSAAILGIVAFT